MYFFKKRVSQQDEEDTTFHVRKGNRFTSCDRSGKCVTCRDMMPGRFMYIRGIVTLNDECQFLSEDLWMRFPAW